MQLCIKYLWISVNCRPKQQNQCDKMCQVISKIDSRDQAKLAIISSSVEKSMMNRDIPHDVPLILEHPKLNMKYETTEYIFQSPCKNCNDLCPRLLYSKN